MQPSQNLQTAGNFTALTDDQLLLLSDYSFVSLPERRRLTPG